MKKRSTPKELENKVTLDSLAVMMAGGFSDLENRLGSKIDHIDQRLSKLIDGLDERTDKLEGKIDGINNRIDDLALNRATRDESKQLNARLTRIERKLAL
jgi:TolA-binding protein